MPEKQSFTSPLHDRGRVELIDALRGFALLGIILLHNVEHFDIANFVTASNSTLAAIDQGVWNTIFFIFGGKCYAIFALMFGFSFYIQFENRKKRGERFAGRFFWRMCLLMLFGIFHVMFYSGEILSCYALVGMLMIPLRNLSNKVLIILMIVFILEPWELIQLVIGLVNPQHEPIAYSKQYYLNAVEAATTATSWWDVIRVNLTSGMASAHSFAWISGRYFQTLALFLCGIVLGRKRLFGEIGEKSNFWKNVWVISIISFIPLYLLKTGSGVSELRPGLSEPLKIMLNIWSNMAFTGFLVSSFTLLWFKTKVKNLEAKLVPYGKMSLTNYISSSVIGSILYYNYGLGLYAYWGPTFSLLTGILIFTLQLMFCRWWLSAYWRGPLETLWNRLTYPTLLRR